MTDEELQQARRIAEAATPGPWEPLQFRSSSEVARRSLVMSRAVPAAVTVSAQSTAEDAEFIAASRALVPQLLDEVERLRAVVSASISLRAQESRAGDDLCARYNAAERHCRGDEARWYLPITDESVCHRCYEGLLDALTGAEQKQLRREPRDFIERDAWRDRWRYLTRPL
jgi:hypothetical protein